MRKRKTRSSYRNKNNLRADYEGRRKKKNKKRHLENQKEKFRKSREWKEFRSKMAALFDHRDYITGRRLVKGFNVHHLKTEQDSENYCDISNEENFIPLNSYCHKLLHYLFPYYMKDKKVISRLVEILDKMVQLSPNYAVEPLEGMDETIEGETDEELDEFNQELESAESEFEEPQYYDLPEMGEDVYISGEELRKQMLEPQTEGDFGTETISPESSTGSFLNDTVS